MMVHKRKFIRVRGKPSFGPELMWVFEHEFVSIIYPTVHRDVCLCIRVSPDPLSVRKDEVSHPSREESTRNSRTTLRNHPLQRNPKSRMDSERLLYHSL